MTRAADPPPSAGRGIGADLRRDHFALVASRWDDHGPPLRPRPQDTAFVQAEADRLGDGARVLVLGLTPETVACRWPPGTRLLAVDHSLTMVNQLWPNPAAPPGAAAVVGNWHRLPVRDGWADLVFGDGCQMTLRWPDGLEAFHRELRRVLHPQGRLVTRVFLRPDTPESVQAIGADLAAGRIGSVHALKLRLFGALHGASGSGTRLDDVWQAWKRLPPHPQPPEQRGWTPGEVATIERHRGLQTRYFAPTLAELRQAIAHDFVERAIMTGDYECAACCPTMVLQRRS